MYLYEAYIALIDRQLYQLNLKSERSDRGNASNAVSIASKKPMRHIICKNIEDISPASLKAPISRSDLIFIFQIDSFNIKALNFAELLKSTAIKCKIGLIACVVFAALQLFQF